MTGIQAVFLLAAATILYSAFQVVTRNNLIHAALFLVLALFGVAVQFVLLEAGFLGMVQILVYIGAIAILMIFAIMLTRGDVEHLPHPLNEMSGWAAMLAILVFSVLVLTLSSWPQFQASAPAFDGAAESVVEIGKSLVSPQAYVIPFELASILLLAAMIGAIMVARPHKKD